jgi:hypothetical protein
MGIAALGFKTLNQVQLTGDSLFYPDWIDATPWLVYSISKPLIGNVETIKIVPAIPDEKLLNGAATALATPRLNGVSSSNKKKDIKSFSDLLNNFPMIARQMQPGLERLFKEFAKELEKPLPELPTEHSTTPISSRHRSGSASSSESRPSSAHSNLTNGSTASSTHYASSLHVSSEEETLRRSLETAVTAAIDMFQLVDKSQLTLLGSSTDLTGTMVERMIERYVAEQFHHSLMFPRLTALRKSDDHELEGRVRQMQDIDISQVGLSLSQGDHYAKKELGVRLSKGVDVFKRMGVAGSPQEMLEILLETEKAITKPALDRPSSAATTAVDGAQPRTNGAEKLDAMLTTSADTLVSLLLVVVIRAPVKYLNARLSYMRHFIFIDDVESGESGYALSTFEAVLSYLLRDSVGLRRASRRNRRLWEASKSGNVPEIRKILEPDAGSDDESHIEPSSPDPVVDDLMANFRFPGPSSLSGTTVNGESEPSSTPRVSFAYEAEEASLDHVFPWQSPTTPTRPKIKKRVSLQSHSTSSSSGYSVASLPETIMSHASALEADTSLDTLARTQGPAGESVMMMAVESGHDAAMRYLLNLEQFYPLERVVEDENNDGTTLLSAAVQSGQPRVIDTILDFIIDHTDSLDMLRDYLARQDSKGRCTAHYLFHYPRLIGRIGSLCSWKLKDKNGQTPLFALCRSYDHEEYRWMVDTALMAATAAQGDGKPLHLDDHIDNKGNTLLHIVNDPQMASKLLYHCDSDANASNDKQFTPLMVASKYGRTDMVRTLFSDPRVDFHAKDLRGLTATELAKDDDVRNRIDDLVLLAVSPGLGDRTTTVVRPYFVEDGTIRFLVKSGAQNPNSTITVTTSRRGLADFEDLAKWLALENPASWIPALHTSHSPFLIPSKPSKAVARDMQLRFDGFLNTLLAHSTFATHEMVWEFFLVPDMDPNLLAERSRMKAETRAEMVRDEFDPLTDVREVEVFVSHAKDSVRGVHHSTKSVLRRTNRVRLAQADLVDAANLASGALHTLAFLPDSHKAAFKRYARTLASPEFSPQAQFYYTFSSISATITAVLSALSKPSDLISRMSLAAKAIERQNASLRRSDRWPTSLALLDETRARMQREALDKLDAAQRERDDLGRELRYTQGVVAGELASWQGERVKWGRQACRELARKMVVLEKARLEGLRRVLRGIGVEEGKSRNSSGSGPILFGEAARTERERRAKMMPAPPSAVGEASGS